MRAKIVQMTMALALLPVLAPSVWAADYFPVSPANEWRYQGSQREEVVARVLETDGNWNRVSQFAHFADQWVYARRGDSKLYVWDGGAHRLLVDFNDPIGTHYDIGSGLCRTGRVTLAGKNETITVPAGFFENVTRLEFESSCIDAGLMSITFAPGVGIVRWITQSIAGPRTTQLVEANVDGRRFPEPAISIMLSSQRLESTINRMPCVGDACTTRNPGPLRLAMEITNRAAQSTPEFRWNSGQEFDIEIYNTRGTMLHRWSEGKAFTQEARRSRLLPRETWRFEGTVDVPTEEGTYIVEMFLTSDPPLRASLTHTVRVVH